MSNTGKAAEESSNTGQPAPVRTPITLTPIQAHITTTTNITEVSKNGKLTEKIPERTEEIVRPANAIGSAFCSAFGVANCPKL